MAHDRRCTASAHRRRSLGARARGGCGNARGAGRGAAAAMTQGDRWFLLLYLSPALPTAFADLRMRAYPAKVVQSYIPGIVNGTEEAPGIYRVLAPFLVYHLSRLTGASLQ